MWRTEPKMGVRLFGVKLVCLSSTFDSIGGKFNHHNCGVQRFEGFMRKANHKSSLDGSHDFYGKVTVDYNST